MYKQLIDLFPTHACREHIEAFKGLEKEGVYSENQIPQLEDVSNFLKRKSNYSHVTRRIYHMTYTWFEYPSAYAVERAP